MRGTNDKTYRQKLRDVKQLVQDALTASEATGVKTLSQTDGTVKVSLQPVSKDFNFYVQDGERMEVKITGLWGLGDVSNTIHAARSIAKTFNAKVDLDFNGTPMTSYPRSTQREVGLDWTYRRMLKQHPELEP